MQTTRKPNLQTNNVKYSKWRENIVKLGVRGRLRNTTKVDERAFLKALSKL